MICLPCGLAADMLALARDEQQHVADVRSGDDLRWLAPVAALVVHLHSWGCPNRIAYDMAEFPGGKIEHRTGCDCQHRIGTDYLPGEAHIRGAHKSDGDAVGQFMDACLTDHRLHEFDAMFADRMIRTTAPAR